MTESDRLYAVECELTPQDSLYYASREAGETFSTRPFLMHTALYYAFGFFPSRFRTAEQSPSYVEHRGGSVLGSEAYVHPATAIDQPRYQTRRFAVKRDSFRTESTRGSGNFKETGHQKMIEPGVSFRTFITTTDTETLDRVREAVPPHIRIGKKMTSTRVNTHVHEVPVHSGTFSLGHPISDLDYPEDTYELQGNIHWERMAPVDLLTEAELDGRHGTVEPHFGEGDTVSLPADAAFLARR